MGPSRVYLGAHWTSDVLGAYMLAVCVWVSGCGSICILKGCLLQDPAEPAIFVSTSSGDGVACFMQERKVAVRFNSKPTLSAYFLNFHSSMKLGQPPKPFTDTGVALFLHR